MFENTIKVLNKFGELLVKEYKQSLVDNNVNTSKKTLYNSVTYLVENNNNTFEVKIELEDYWKDVENGRKSGEYVDFDVIKNWIKIKPIIPRPFRNGYLPTINHLTQLIQDKIYLKGIEPRPLFKQSLDKVFDEMSVELENAVIEDCSHIINIELLKIP